MDEGTGHVGILHQAHFHGNAAFLGVADGSAEAGVRHADYHIGLHGAFPIQELSGFLSESVYVDAVYVAVGAGKVDIFHGAGGAAHAGGVGETLHSFFREFYNFSGLYVAKLLCPQRIQGAGFTGSSITVGQSAHRKRPKAVLVAAGVEGVAREHQERERAVHLAQDAGEDLRVDIGPHLQGLADERPEELAVGGGGEEHAAGRQGCRQLAGVDDVPVVGRGIGAALPAEDKRLHVLYSVAAEGSVAHVADGVRAFPGTGLPFRKDGRYQPKALLQGYFSVFVGIGDSASFLAAMLQESEACPDDAGGSRDAEDAHDAALFVNLGGHITGWRQSP